MTTPTVPGTTPPTDQPTAATEAKSKDDQETNRSVLIDDILYDARTGDTLSLPCQLGHLTTAQAGSTRPALSIREIYDHETKNTILHMCAANNHAETQGQILEYIRLHGPSEAEEFANLQNGQGNTALHYAAMNGALDCARALVDKGPKGWAADRDIRNRAGRTAGEEADAAGRDEVAAWFAAEGILSDGIEFEEEQDVEGKEEMGKDDTTEEI